MSSFLPENSQYYWHLMGGQKRIRYVPNCEHSMAGHVDDVLGSIVAFSQTLLSGRPLPSIDWETDDVTRAITMTVNPLNPPDEVLLWQATNPRSRSMMIFHTGPLAWTSTPVTPVDGVYRAALNAPAEGYTGFYLEARFRNGAGPFNYFKLTTLTSMVPYVYQHEPCGTPCNCGAPMDCQAKGLRIFDDNGNPIAQLGA